MPAIIQRLITALIDKKKIIGWVAAAIMAVVAVVLGMNTAELKSAVCSGPTLELPAPAPAAEAPKPEVK